jgi:hypothetical protein
MRDIGRRAAGVLLAAATMTGVAAGVAVARSGAPSGTLNNGPDSGTRTFLVQTQTPQPPDGTGRHICPNRDGGNGSSPPPTPSDTSI